MAEELPPTTPGPTPGPWFLRQVPLAQFHGVYTADGRCIVSNFASRVPEAEDMPNMRIISSAPALLAALQKVAAHAPSEKVCWMEDVESAIAQATGKDVPQ